MNVDNWKGDDVLFSLALKKMFKNKWITVCLFLGCFLIVAIACSIPTYTDGVLSKLLLRDLQNVQTQSSTYPGTYALDAIYGSTSSEKNQGYNNYKKNLEKINSLFADKEIQKLDRINDIDSIGTDAFHVFADTEKTLNKSTAINSLTKIKATRGIEDKIKVIYGDMYSSGKKDDYYEVIISQGASKKYNLSTGQKYKFQLATNDFEKNPIYQIKIVGVFEMKDKADSFWYNGFASYENAVLMDYDTLSCDMIKNDNYMFKTSSLGFTYDYNKLKAEQMKTLLPVFRNQQEILKRRNEVNNPALRVMESYSGRADKLSILILLLDIPLIVVLLFYISMISKLIIGFDENEISVLKSRGATRTQILTLYLIECLIISTVSFVTAIPFGMVVSNVIGYSNGFLQFVNRAKLPIQFTPQIIIYALTAIALFIFATLLPIVFASRKNILSHKQQRTAEIKMPLWQKACVDLILMGISVYGLYLYNEAQAVALATNITDYKSSNPLIFIMSSMFILGACLLVLRIYPLMIKLLHFIGKRFWPASIHVSMINLSRNKLMGKTIILFLMFTVSVGIFNAATARSINRSEEDKIKYNNGADLVVREQWTQTGVLATGGEDNPDWFIPAFTVPPPYDRYSKIEGVESTARVYNCKNGAVAETGNGRKVERLNLLAVVPNEFAKTAWTRDDLLPYHMNEYLDVLAKYPKGCIISTGMSKKLGIKAGDEIYINIGKFVMMSEGITLTVVSVVDYFPSYDSSKKSINIDDEKDGANEIIVMNMDYLFKYLPVDQYEVWMKRAEGATTKQIYNSMQEQGIGSSIGESGGDVSGLNQFKATPPTTIVNSQEQIIKDIKNDAIIQGMNGTLSLAFIMSLIITSTGFLIYWIIDVKSRSLQFSVLRSMGISKKSLYSMLIFEQLLTSSFAIIGGTIIGGFASTLYIRSVGMYMGLSTQIPPIKVIIQIDDYVKIYVVVILLIIVCLAAVIAIIRRMNIAATLKLGED